MKAAHQDEITEALLVLLDASVKSQSAFTAPEVIVPTLREGMQTAYNTLLPLLDDKHTKTVGDRIAHHLRNGYRPSGELQEAPDARHD